MTRLQFVCSPDSGVGEPLVVQDLANDACTTHVLWASLAGCRQCEASDYASSLHACVDGQRRRTEERVGACNGAQLRDLGLEDCVVEFAFPYWVLIAAGVVVLLLCLCALVCTLKNRYGAAAATAACLPHRAAVPGVCRTNTASCKDTPATKRRCR